MTTSAIDTDHDLVVRLKSIQIEVHTIETELGQVEARRLELRRELRSREAMLRSLLGELAEPTPMPLFEGATDDDAKPEAGDAGSGLVSQEPGADHAPPRQDRDGAGVGKRARAAKRAGDCQLVKGGGAGGEPAAVPAGQLTPVDEHAIAVYCPECNVGAGTKCKRKKGTDILAEGSHSARYYLAKYKRELNVTRTGREAHDTALLAAIKADDRDHHWRWTELVRDGASDNEIKSNVAISFGTGTVVSSHLVVADERVNFSFRGGRSPAFWLGWHRSLDDHIKNTPEPTLKGQAMVDAVRRVLAIPRPKLAEVAS
jgi:hypothetical protein